MIKANEIRVGNIICDYTGVIREVNGRDLFDQWWFDSEPGDGSLCAPLNPIELTPEWLGKMGFEKKKDEDSNNYLSYGILKLDGFISKEEDGYYLSITDLDGYHEQRVGKKIEYVHQLQNLYFALTCEELTIKTEPV